MSSQAEEQKRKKRKIDDVDEDSLKFSAKKGQIIAVYPDKEQDKANRRFWIAEAAHPISKQGGDAMCSIYFYAADNDDYTTFKLEDSRKVKRKLPYASCLCLVSTVKKSNKNIVTITKWERDRISALGRALDERE